MSSDPTKPDPDWFGAYDGYVHDNADPMGLGRCKVVVPGLLEPYSGWAMPYGNAGGGDQAGFWFPLKIGAEVGVFFLHGNPDAVRFVPGGWGAPKGKAEVPLAVRDLSPADRLLVKVIQTDRWELVFDDRPGHESMRIKDLQFDEDVIEIDGVNHGVTVSGSAAVLIKAVGVINLQALQIMLNGRIVRDTKDPI